VLVVAHQQHDVAVVFAGQRVARDSCVGRLVDGLDIRFWHSSTTPSCRKAGKPGWSPAGRHRPPGCQREGWGCGKRRQDRQKQRPRSAPSGSFKHWIAIAASTLIQPGQPVGIVGPLQRTESGTEIRRGDRYSDFPLHRQRLYQISRPNACRLSWSRSSHALTVIPNCQPEQDSQIRRLRNELHGPVHKVDQHAARVR